MLLKQPKYVLLFGCCAILLLLVITSLASSVLVNTVKSTPEITTQFNFPRYLSDTERTAPPAIPKNIRYTVVETSMTNKGSDVNWTRILEKGPYDVVVISDSFLGVPQGRYLCKNLSATHNVSVLHIIANSFAFANENPFRVLVILTNNGFLKKSGAKVVILECAERNLPTAITRSGSLADSPPMPAATDKRSGSIPSTDVKNITDHPSVPDTLGRSAEYFDAVIHENEKGIVTVKTWIKNDILSFMGSQSNDGTFYFRRLNESRFTGKPYSSTLIFFYADIASFQNYTGAYPEAYIETNKNLNVIAGRLQDQNITLFFIPGVSAYNTYYPYIIDPPTVRNPLFEVMRELNRSYVMIDTKDVVMKMQQNGEKDLSGIGDPTHWTWRVTDRIAQEIDLQEKPPRQPAGDPADEYRRAVLAFRSVIYERGLTRDLWALKMDGQIYERESDYLNATRCYQRSLELDPRQPLLRMKLSNLSGTTF